MDDIISSLMNHREANHDYNISELINEYGDHLRDTSSFDGLINYEVEEFLDLMVRSLYPDLDDNKFYKVSFLYQHRKFYEQQLEYLIEANEGIPCVSDKSDWLIESYLEYLLRGVPLEFSEKTHFWQPGFGTSTEWIGLMDSLIEMYHGSPLNYLKNLKEFQKIPSSIIIKRSDVIEQSLR